MSSTSVSSGTISSGTPSSSSTDATTSTSAPGPVFFSSDGPQYSGSPLPPCNGPGCPNATAPPAALYLYTFLSTLIVLLLVSCAIILRSLLLRRRQRIAMENGTWIPPHMPFAGSGRRTRNPFAGMPKPVLFDVHFQPTGGSPATSHMPEVADARWAGLQPFYASSISPIPPINSSSASASTPPLATTPVSSVQRFRRSVRAIVHYFYPPSPPPAQTPHDSPTMPTYDGDKTRGSSSSPTDPSAVRLAVLVTMPFQQPVQIYPDDEEAALPHDVCSSVESSGKIPMVRIDGR
ncbi:hypothetical protein C8F01DRAFT_1130332 [Mycena amicta]|nr:hypothetical protein C8F01DRAFT_1130332 [Mycena amicta]